MVESVSWRFEVIGSGQSSYQNHIVEGHLIKILSNFTMVDVGKS